MAATYLSGVEEAGEARGSLLRGQLGRVHERQQLRHKFPLPGPVLHALDDSL